MTQFGVVGSPQFTLGFRLAGIRKIWDAETPEAVEAAVAAARRDSDVSILVMETKDLQGLNTRLRHELVASVRPTLVAVGTEDDNTLREKIKQAVGVDLW